MWEVGQDLNHYPSCTMQALFDLVHSLAKEEKRLYNLHAREGRFIHIYKGYATAESYSKELDRELYQKHFSSFSKAFYSMQKSALLDDILAVLLEYSNSSHSTFNAIRHQSKYEVLLYRGFPDAALGYLKAAIEELGATASPRKLLHLLEDQRGALAKSRQTTWEEFQEVQNRIEEAGRAVANMAEMELSEQKLSVLLATATRADERKAYHEAALEVVEQIKQIALGDPHPDNLRIAFEAEFHFSEVFESALARHHRLVALEKENSPGRDRALRMRITTLLMESSMECGDFLRVNGIIYKADKEIQGFSQEEKGRFCLRYLELCSLYHFYENELPTSQRELNDILGYAGLDDGSYRRFHLQKVAYCIAANMPKYAQDALNSMYEAIPELRQDLIARLMELMIAVEGNRRDEALVMLQKMRVLLRRSPDSRKLSQYRLFLELLQKLLSKKKVAWQDIPGFQTPWTHPLKPSLWLRAKIENKFYYNFILDDWQARKKILYA
jgi:hypothetical protein